MNLCLDIGNSQIKAAVFDQINLLEIKRFSFPDAETELNDLFDRYTIQHGIISNVARTDRLLLQLLQEQIDHLILLNHNTAIPFVNSYSTPETLGVDRLALVAAGVSQFPGSNVLIIDAGSCITLDFVDSNGDYKGGAITLGINMRYKSVNAFTANLPLLEIPTNIPPVGNSTVNAIHLGILKGVIYELEGTIQTYRSQNEKLTVVLTGGNTNFLAKNLKSSIFAIPNFLLEGLNSILIHNIDG